MLAAAGLTNKEIGQQLFLSQSAAQISSFCVPELTVAKALAAAQIGGSGAIGVSSAVTFVGDLSHRLLKRVMRREAARPITEDDVLVTSPQSLLYAAASDITIERVRALVRQVGPESPTVEYKGQMAHTIARGVAALVNTYGGLLLVGVTNDRIVKGVKEKTIESVAEHYMAKIEPPRVPEMIPVPLRQGSGLYVLVLRVVPGRHLRPLLWTGSRTSGTRTPLTPQTDSACGNCSLTVPSAARMTSGTFMPRSCRTPLTALPTAGWTLSCGRALTSPSSREPGGGRWPNARSRRSPTP
jgi:Putative DNA-binding domain